MIHVRADVHQARDHQRNAYDEVPDQLKARNLTALEMGELVDEQRRAQQREDRDQRGDYVQRRTEGHPRADDQRRPTDNRGSQQIAPIDGPTRLEVEPDLLDDCSHVQRLMHAYWRRRRDVTHRDLNAPD